MNPYEVLEHIKLDLAHPEEFVDTNAQIKCVLDRIEQALANQPGQKERG